MYHTAVYNGAAVGVNASNFDLSAATDTILSQRNGHYVFTDKFKLGAAALVGASVTRGRLFSPTLNAIGEWSVFNANRSLQPPSNPQWDDWRVYGPDIPLVEEFQAQSSNNLGASTEQESIVLQLLPTGWTAGLARGRQPTPFIQRTSFTVTPTLNAWSGAQNLTFSQSLRGGLYAVLGAVCQGSNSVAWRLIFPRAPTYGNRILRPGGLTQNAVGDVVNNQLDPWAMPFGTLGVFHTFEPVQAEVFGTAASSTTYQLFLWLAFLGEGTDPLSAYGAQAA